MPADITVLIAGTDPERVERTRRALGAQTRPADATAVSGWDDIAGALRGVATACVAVLPAGVEPGPSWCGRAAAHMGDPAVGCVGGRTLAVDGPATLSQWFDASERLAWLEGRDLLPVDRLDGIPSQPVVRDVPFLRLDTMVARTDLVRRRLDAGVPYADTVHDVPTCRMACAAGMRVVYDSSLVAVAHFRDRVTLEPSEAWEVSGRADVVVLRWCSRGPRRAWLIARSLLLGTRRSPGLLMGIAYLPWARRRARWRGYIAGKLEALRDPLR